MHELWGLMRWRSLRVWPHAQLAQPQFAAERHAAGSRGMGPSKGLGVGALHPSLAPVMMLTCVMGT
jgi:hypothetical protein